MVMYRLVTENENSEELCVHDEDIPDEVKSDVLIQDVVMNEAKVEREKKSAKMQLKIIYQDEQKVFWVNRKEDTYNTLFETSMREFFGSDYEQKVRKENFRLRAYNV